jgi:hypothetical protein
MSLFGRLLGRHKARWEEAWHTFPGTFDEGSAVWSVDLGAVYAAPVAHLPVRVDVEAPYAADANGLPADGSDVTRLEEAVRRTVSSLDGAYVGRVVGGGRVRFTAHVPAEPSAPVSLPGAPGVEVRTEYDPHWAYVRDALTPDDRQHRLIADLALVDHLAADGDPLTSPRGVAHVAVFADPAGAEQAAADLRASGFTTGVERDEEGEFMLTAVRSDPVAPPGIHELTWTVKETVERHGGTYDGWNGAPDAG